LRSKYFYAKKFRVKKSKNFSLKIQKSFLAEKTFLTEKIIFGRTKIIFGRKYHFLCGKSFVGILNRACIPTLLLSSSVVKMGIVVTPDELFDQREYPRYTESNDAVFSRTYPLLYHKFGNMLFFSQAKLYALFSPGNQHYQKIIFYFFFIKKGRNQSSIITFQ